MLRSAAAHMQADARDALHALLEAPRDGQPVQLRAGSNKTATVPEPALELLMEILGHLANGTSVTVIPIHAELTTQQAADLLNVSRPHFVSLLAAGNISHRKVGTHRRVRLQDLLAYKQQRDDDARAAVDALTREAQDLGLGY